MNTKAVDTLPSHRILRRIMHGESDGPLLWWTSGVQHALIAGRITPLWNMQVLSVGRIASTGEDQYEIHAYEVVLRTNARTGEVLREWKNPFTGQACKVPIMRTKPDTQRYGRHGVEPGHRPGLILNHHYALAPIGFDGSDIWLWADGRHRLTLPDGTERQINELAIYSATRSEVLDDAVRVPSGYVALHSISAWYGWMGMAEGPAGSVMTRAFGRKATDLNVIPDELRRALAAEAPDVLDNPMATL